MALQGWCRMTLGLNAYDVVVYVVTIQRKIFQLVVPGAVPGPECHSFPTVSHGSHTAVPKIDDC